MPYRTDIAGWMQERELRHIEWLATKVPEHGNMIEVGCLSGRSAWAWANSIPSSAMLHCVDPWRDDIYDLHLISGVVPETPFRNKMEYFQTNMAECGNVIATRGVSSQVLPRLRQNFYDLIFLDGSHDNPVFKDDLQMSLALLKSGGTLCGHDYTGQYPDIINEVARLSQRLAVPTLIEPDGIIWRIEIP